MTDTSSQYARVQEVFLRVRGLTPSQRKAELERHDVPVREEVLSLLAADNNCGDFLDNGVANASDSQSALLECDIPPTDISSKEPNALPETIGPFRILQLIGEGGFGSVYMAEQTESVYRKVAIKMIKPGMDSKQVLARFQAERQALAMMEHPSIARVFDAGTSATGSPYFVMELVRGIPIDEFCEANSLELTERLQLFRQVCDAVHHAHRKGIIHRDLKPSNVLVGMGEGGPIAKVIDFGIAKALDRRLTEATLFTEFGQMIGTLEYMSPEQAEMSAVDIDTRSDVYSLGVMLYRLLTGSTPISKDALVRSGMLEIPRMIRETMPTIPSAFMSIGEGKSTQGSKINGLEPIPKGDLDWVTMKCLSKDRRERYDSAKALSQDLDAFVNGRPVNAHPPSLIYRLRKALQRNRVAAMLSMVVAASLLVGLAGLVTGLRDSRRGREVAERSLANAVEARKVADQNARRLAENMYSELVESAWRATQQGNSQRATELLDACETDLRGWEWRFVHDEMKSHSETLLRQAGQSGILAVAVHDSRPLIGVVLANGNVELRDSTTDQLIQSLEPVGRATTLAFLNDTALIGTGGGEVIQLSIDDWTQKYESHLAAGGIYDIQVSDGGDVYAVSTGAAWVKVFASKSHELLDEWELPSRVASLLFNTNRSLLLGAGLDGQLYGMSLGETRHTSTVISLSSLLSVSRLDDHRVCVLTGGGAVAVAVSDLDNPERVMSSEIARINGVATCLAVSDVGSVALCGGDGSVVVASELGDATDGTPKRSFAISIGAAVWVPADKRFLIGLSDGRIVAWEPAEEQNGWRKQIDGNLTDGVLLPEHSIAISVDDKGMLTQRDIETGEVRLNRRLHSAAIWSVSSADTNERYVATVGEDQMLRCWELPAMKLKFEAAVGWGVRDVCMSPDGKRVAGPPPANSDAPYQEGTIGVWDVSMGECVEVLHGHMNWVLALDFTPNGSLLVSGCENGETRCWNAASWEPEKTIEPALRAPPQHFAFTEDAIVVGHRDGWVTLWDKESGKSLGEWSAFGDALTGISVTADKRILATSRSSGQMKVWSISEKAKVAEFNLGMGYITNFSASQYFGYMSLANRDGLLRVRELSCGSPALE